MHKEVSEFFDLVSIVALLLMSISAICVLASEWWDTGITHIEDKSIQYVYVADGDDGYTGEDILGMLLAVDRQTPDPKAIKFNGQPNVIKFDDIWLENKTANIRDIMYGAAIDLSSKLDQKVQSITYEQDSSGNGYFLITF